MLLLFEVMTYSINCLKTLEDARKYLTTLGPFLCKTEIIMDCQNFQTILILITLRYFISGNGFITFNEFLHSFVAKKPERASPTLDTLQHIFAKEDRDQDGFLDYEECNRALKSLGHNLNATSASRVFELMDKDNDGRISINGIYCTES